MDHGNPSMDGLSHSMCSVVTSSGISNPRFQLNGLSETSRYSNITGLVFFVFFMLGCFYNYVCFVISLFVGVILILYDFVIII